jgi:hypothetical protein
MVNVHRTATDVRVESVVTMATDEYLQRMRKEASGSQTQFHLSPFAHIKQKKVARGVCQTI